MSAYIADRDALADVMGAMPEAYNVTDYTDEQTTMITAPVDSIADALIASGAVVAADSLADDKALVWQVARSDYDMHAGEGARDYDDDWVTQAEQTLRALAATLTERAQ